MINTITGILNAAAVTAVATIGTLDYKEYVTERECLALNVYHEARSESIEGQIAVAQVTVNRVQHEYFPDTICDVVWDRYQFSWTHDGLSDRATETDAWKDAMLVAQAVLSNRVEDNTNGSLFYHADYVNPGWPNMKTTAKIGRHIFYKKVS